VVRGRLASESAYDGPCRGAHKRPYRTCDATNGSACCYATRRSANARAHRVKVGRLGDRIPRMNVFLFMCDGHDGLLISRDDLPRLAMTRASQVPVGSGIDFARKAGHIACPRVPVFNFGTQEIQMAKIRTLILLGLAGAWALNQQKRRKVANQTKGSTHTLASLVGDRPKAHADQPVPTAENPFPKGNPTMVPTGVGPGG
jgi:hypothetical protein